MVYNFFNRIKSVFFVFISFLRVSKVSEIKTFKVNGYFYSGYQLDNEKGVRFIYSSLNKQELTGARLRFFNHVGSRVMIVVTEEAGSSHEIGINMYYLNPRDLKERTIHEGFIGVLPEHEGKGIASQMRKIAIEHFRAAGFKGISTRISKKNLGSLRSAEKLGFKPVEEYYDEKVDEERYYLVCNFKG